jgi:uncharacterized membrane protein
MPTERITETPKNKVVRHPAWKGDGRAMTPRPQEALGRGHAMRPARALGWFSVALGAAQLVAPGSLARLIGARDTSATRLILRALGARELASGLALLGGGRTERWLWARAVGDAMDLGLLGAAWGARRADHMRLGATGAAVAGVAVLDVLAARRAHRGEETALRGVEVSRSVTIKTSPRELHRFWRSLGNLPRFMAHLESVEAIDDRRSRWCARGPAGMKIEWEAEIVEDRPGELIAWRSLDGADVHNEGEVRFASAPGGRGTEVHVALRYRAMGGAVGRAVARLLGSEPGQQIAGDLRRLKQVIETGEVVHSDASIHRGAHPARPPASVPPLPGTKKGGA